MFVIYAQEGDLVPGQKMASFEDEEEAREWADEQDFHYSYAVVDSEESLVDYGEGWEEL